MKRVSWKYLAGLIDGEGCIDLAPQKLGEKFYIRPRLRVRMAIGAQDLLEGFYHSFGGNFYVHKSDNPAWQDQVSWELVGYATTNGVLRNIVNHLILKREQARLCLWMNEHMKGKQISQRAVALAREELTLMKRDPHRLSETAQTRIWDAIVETAEMQR